MNERELIEYIKKPGISPGLERIEKLLSRLGDPQKKLRFAHIAGTNGKGSTAAYAANILAEAGYKTGVYTSPEIESFTELISIYTCTGEKNISIEEAGYLADMIQAAGVEATGFEILTAMAFLYFAEKKCDIVVLETGMGGRLDATNVIDVPEVAVITSISIDHTAFLGDSMGKIAMEKAGIIKDGGCVVLYPQEREVDGLIEEACHKRHAALHRVQREYIVERTSYGSRGEGSVFDYAPYKGLEITMPGEHQIMNAATAVVISGVLEGCGYIIEENHIRRGLYKTRLTGRLELIYASPRFYIDVAHNGGGAFALAENLKRCECVKVIFIIGVLADKDADAIIRPLAAIAGKFLCVTPDSPRAMPARELAERVGKYHPEPEICVSTRYAVNEALRLAGADGVICAAGSFTFMADVKSEIDKNEIKMK